VILLDYSKNRINSKTHELLVQLAEECGLKDAIEQQFRGEIINETEGRAVLHTALRNPHKTGFILDGNDILPDIHRVLDKMEHFSNQVIKILSKMASSRPNSHTPRQSHSFAIVNVPLQLQRRVSSRRR
jgi:glucose-6-phosphate isomerase